MENIVNINNQAGRLHKILSAAAKMSDGAPTKAVWANVFGVDIEDIKTILQRYISLQELADSINDTIINMSNVNSKLLLSQHNKIDRVVKATNLDTHWGTYKIFLTETVLINLAHCAEALSIYDEKQIDSDILSELNGEISELFDKITDSEINSELKIIIQDLLVSIRRSIDEYKIRGAKGIRNELAYCYGKIMQNYKIIKEFESTEEVKSLWKIIARTDNLTTVALNIVSIGTSVFNNLLSICHKL